MCDLPQELLHYYAIDVMYYYVNTEKGRFRDIQEIMTDNLLEYMAKHSDECRSEYAQIKEYESFFAEELEQGENVIHITMASASSGAYKAASAAAESFNNVSVFWTSVCRNGSHGTICGTDGKRWKLYLRNS